MKIHSTLILNGHYCPIHLVDFKKTMSLVYQGSAKCLDRDYVSYNWDSWLEFSRSIEASTYKFIHTVKYAIAIPEIIVLLDFFKVPQREIKFSRESVFSRDSYKCGFCGQVFVPKDLTIDHIIPISQKDRHEGSPTHFMNVISACRPCNYKKANRDPSQASMPLLFQPRKPKWISPLSKATTNECLPSWEHFLNRQAISLGD